MYLNLAMHFQVPHCKANGQEVNKFIDLDYEDDYEDVLEQLYKAIGCHDILEDSRPELVCHFSKDKQNQKYDLNDWTYIKKKYIEEVNKKGLDNALIEIILPKQARLLRSC
jgi:pyoverdine/dityrosine biosynthesis protein Dit1